MLADLQNAYIQAVERAGDSTVNVSTAQRPYGPSWGSWPRRGFGSGVVLDDQGNILTTHHVVDGAEKVIVTFSAPSTTWCVVRMFPWSSRTTPDPKPRRGHEPHDGP